MVKRFLALAVIAGALLRAGTSAQAPVQGATPPQTPAPAPAGQVAGTQGDPDPGVHFIVVVDNPHVRVLQTTLQPGAARRPHVHNDVTFHMLVPVTGSLELIIEQRAPIVAAPGQAYYVMKGEAHTVANRTAAPVQAIELFVKPPAAP
jgi:quercetin dioxygenase-like cupin family protein